MLFQAGIKPETINKVKPANPFKKTTYHMKTKSLLLTLAAVLISGSLGLTSCKKKKEFKNEDGQTSADNRTVQSENDNAISDVNNVVANQGTLHGKMMASAKTNAITGNICGLVVDTTGMYLGTIKLNYDGTVCYNRKREGSIRLTILNFASGVRWKHAGCVLKVEYIGYKVTRASDGKSIELNGVQNITNITGGTWWELLITKTQAALDHSVTGNDLNVTFDGSNTAVYNINRKFSYTLPNDILTCTGYGIGSSNGINDLENYGTTRDGDAFTSQVKTPIVWNLTCGPWAPVQGELEIKVDDKSFSLNCTFGVDASGNSVAVAQNSCPYGWKVSWTYKKKTEQKIFGYY
jgi:hypothetical protein